MGDDLAHTSRVSVDTQLGAAGSDSPSPISMPPLERQGALQAAYEANIEAGRSPYEGVHIRSRDELSWILRERDWVVDYDSFTVKYDLAGQGVAVEQANLSGALFGAIDLSGVRLRRANLQRANLVRAKLDHADFVDSDLSEADLGFADLTGANLSFVDLSGAHLREAVFASANLRYTNLCGTRIYKADLHNATLVGARMDPSTVLVRVILDERTRIRDVIWNGAPLVKVNWTQAPRFGDELDARQSRTPDGRSKTNRERLDQFQSAAWAYSQLATALDAQGLSEPAGHYAYRARVLQRKVFWRRAALGRWLFSCLLAVLAGYGYRMSRILLAYVVIIALFAGIYGILGLPQGTPVSWQNAILISLTAFHGRVFAEQFRLGTPQAWATAIEAVCGLIVESVFIGMLAQRFFGK